MSESVPLGLQEDQRLEFESAEALARPEIIGREVAAMLNAEGGEIWVGLRDRNGRAVEVQGIDGAEQASESLRDFLVDSLEPSPLPEEVRVEPVPVDQESCVLRIHLLPRKERQPYAFLKSGGRFFMIRVDARIRPMSRGEVFSFRREGGRLEATIEEVMTERTEAGTVLRDALWLRLRPVEEIEIDLQSPIFEELVTNPAASGNRKTGWHFATAWSAPERSRDILRWGYPELAFEVQVRADGAMLFTAALRTLHWKGEEHEIWPLCLLEYPVSAFRLAREIYRSRPDDDDRVVADLAFFGIGGWKLREGSPLRSLFWTSDPVTYPDSDEDLTWARPLVFHRREIDEAPDRCGFRLVRRVYEAFGMREQALPSEYDRQTGRLVLQD